MLVIAALTVTGFLGYFGSLHSPFLYDDTHAIIENPYTQNLDPYPERFQPEFSFYRPVLTFTFALNRVLGGLDVFGYHLVNIALHIMVSVVFFFLARELLVLAPEDRQPSLRHLPALAAFLHLLHPLNVQAVVYLSSRSSVLATLFYIVAFYCFARCYRIWQTAQEDPKGVIFCLVGMILFFVGCGVKEITITLPVMAFLYYLILSHRVRHTPEPLLLMLTLVPFVAYLAYRVTLLGDPLILPAEPEVPTRMSRWLYFLTQIKSFPAYYLLKFFLPFNLNFEPDIRLVPGVTASVILSALGVIGVMAWLFWRKSYLLFFGLLWAVVTLSPTSSVIPLKQIVTEHRFYLPGLGMHLVLGALLIGAVRRVPRAWPVLPVCLVLFFILVQHRVLDYRTKVTLWQDTARKSPNKALVHNNLAVALLEEKRYEEAEKALQRTLELDPKNDNAEINLGFILIQRGQYQEALRHFLKVIKRGTREHTAYYNAGRALIELKRPEEAINFFKQAVEMKPDSAEYLFWLGQAYQLAKMPDDALKAYRKSLKLDPNNAKAHNNIGTIFWDLKSFFLAAAEFEKAYQLDNTLVTTLNNLVSANMVLRQYDTAIEYLNRLLELDPDNENARQMLEAAQRLKETQNEPPRPVH